MILRRAIKYYLHVSEATKIHSSKLELINNNTNFGKYYSTNQNSSNFFSCYSSAKFSIPTSHVHKPKWVEVPQLLLKNQYVNEDEIKIADPIPIELVKQIHEHEYVDRFLDGTITQREMRRMGFDEWNEYVRNRVLHTIGASVCGTKDALYDNVSRRASNLAGKLFGV